MVHYKEARDIFYTMMPGESKTYSKEDFAKVQQSLNVVKRRHITVSIFKSSKKTLTIWRIK